SICECCDKVLRGGTKVRAADLSLPREGGSASDSSGGTCGTEVTVVGGTTRSAHDAVRRAGLGVLRIPSTRVGCVEPTVCTADRYCADRYRLIIRDACYAQARGIVRCEALFVDKMSYPLAKL